MERILVAIDASPNAERVLERAAELARRTGAKLILFRAIGIPFEIPRDAYSLPPDALTERLEQEAKGYLEGLAKKVEGDLVQGTLVHVGNPWQAICAAAKEQGADLVVIGSHGYHGIDRILGTTAAKVVNHIDRPVLVVREAAAAA